MSNTNFTTILNELLNKFNDTPVSPQENDLWDRLKKTGTELWLDTGDIDAAKELWNSNFTALTTNNTLLNKEVQKGIYDNIIKDAALFYDKLNIDRKVKEIALVLNALHGLRLVKIFNAKVSVELHTDLAHDIDGIVHFGSKLHNVDPDHFIIKVPFTAEGLIGARKLHDKGIPVNFTLMFSARQNILAAMIAQPAYSNVFLGRIGAFLKDNDLGSSDFIGEQVTNATQKNLTELRGKGKTKTKLIAASIRNWKQLLLLKGLDVYTMPIAVASGALDNLDPSNNIPFEQPGEINLTSNISGLEKLWHVNEKVFETAEYLSTKITSSGDEIIEIAKEKGLEDMFPILNEEEKQTIMTDGKIPVFKHWKEEISKNKTAIDSLLNLSGLYAFKKDQEALDNRIKQKLTS